MTNLVILKTDASYKPDVGSGVSFQSQIIEGGRKIDTFSDNRFIRNVENSTDAELLAVVFGIMEMVKYLDEYGKYEIAIESDCSYVVDVFDGRNKGKYKMKKTAMFFLRKFEGWRVRWIPRDINSEADALAKSALFNSEYYYHD